MERVVAYVDGYNLYYGLRAKHWKWYYWLNIQLLAQHLIKSNQLLIATKYFTTIVKYPEKRHHRQGVFLEALQTLPNFEIFYGHFLATTVTCRNCGHAHETYHEKMTDVNISVELMTDAFQDKFDTALMISADSDLVGPVKAVRRLFNRKKVVVAFPPARSSVALQRTAHGFYFIGRDKLSKSVFPDEVIKSGGFSICRPAEWR